MKTKGASEIRRIYVYMESRSWGILRKLPQPLRTTLTLMRDRRLNYIWAPANTMNVWLFLYWNELQAWLNKWKYNFKNWKKKTLKLACRFVKKLKLKNSSFSFSNFSVLLTVRMRMKRTSISSGFLCNCQLTENCVEVKRNKMWQVVLCQFRSALFYLCYFWAEWRHDPIVGSRRPGGRDWKAPSNRTISSQKL